MERHAKIVQQYDIKVSEASRQFERILDSSETLQSRTRAMNLARAALSLLKDSSDRVNVSRDFLAIRNWWEVFVHERYPEDYCQEYLKCSRKTYIYLVKALLRSNIRTRLGAAPQRQHLDMSIGFSVEKQVAVTLHKIVCSADYAAVTGMFGIYKLAVRKIFYNVIRGINKHLLKILVRMPRWEEAKRIAMLLEDLSKIPQLIGSLESTHIPICDFGQRQFTNSKNYHSVELQTVVDANCCFRDVSVRHPGSASDRRVFEDSSIYRLHERVIPAAERREMDGLELPYKIAASHSYPLLSWLLTEYEPAASKSEQTFNDHLRIVRYCSAAALARLNARFSILNRQIDVSYKIAPQIIAACCAVHNICENHQDPFPDVWLKEAMQYCDRFPQPERSATSPAIIWAGN